MEGGPVHHQHLLAKSLQVRRVSRTTDQRRNPFGAGTYSKDECITQCEYQYHPNVYKTALCAQYSEFGYCRFGPHCAYRHVYQGRDDDRDMQKYFDGVKAWACSSSHPHSAAKAMTKLRDWVAA